MKATYQTDRHKEINIYWCTGVVVVSFLARHIAYHVDTLSFITHVPTSEMRELPLKFDEKTLEFPQ
jgi:hypothetical protein